MKIVLKQIVFFLILVSFASCVSKEKSVNSNTDSTLVNYTANIVSGLAERRGGQQNDSGAPIDSPLYSPKLVSMAGILFLKMDANVPPIRLSNVSINIQTFKDNKWIHFSSVQTDHDGKFSVTEKTPYGRYKLVVDDSRYSGETLVTLDVRPMINIYFEVSKKAEK